jgi:hypothetical protein
MSGIEPPTISAIPAKRAHRRMHVTMIYPRTKEPGSSRRFAIKLIKFPIVAQHDERGQEYLFEKCVCLPHLYGDETTARR